MRFWLLLAMLALVVAAPAWAQVPQPDLAKIATRYVAAQEAVMEKNAGAPQADALMAFYSDGYIYFHPQFGAKVTGRDSVRRGITSHFGESADAAIVIKALIVNGNTVALAVEEGFTDIASRKRVARQRITVLTFNGDKIVQRVDI